MDSNKISPKETITSHYLFFSKWISGKYLFLTAKIEEADEEFEKIQQFK